MEEGCRLAEEVLILKCPVVNLGRAALEARDGAVRKQGAQGFPKACAVVLGKRQYGLPHLLGSGKSVS
jgi:hypothetical protein